MLCEGFNARPKEKPNPYWRTPKILHIRLNRVQAAVVHFTIATALLSLLAGARSGASRVPAPQILKEPSPRIPSWLLSRRQYTCSRENSALPEERIMTTRGHVAKPLWAALVGEPMTRRVAMVAKNPGPFVGDAAQHVWQRFESVLRYG